jgi:iron complex outermembrane recepter protein
MTTIRVSARLVALHASTCGVALLAASAALAQAAPAAVEPAAAPAVSGVGDIVVTATRRAQRLQDVPVSVTALTSETLARSNFRDINDLPKMVPGLTLNYGSQPGNNSINLRGIGTLTNGIAVESDVAVVIDDVPIGFQGQAFQNLSDIERVEVLKGPQSTLFGKSAIAGVLNITTQAATDRWTGRASALVTDDHEYRLGGTVSGPLTDTLKMRLTASRDFWDGNIRNLTDGNRLNGTKGYIITGKLQWDPTSQISMTLAPRYNYTNTDCCVQPFRSLTPGLFYQGITQLPESTVLAGIPVNDRWNRRVRNDVRAGGVSRSWGATLHAGYNFDDGILTGSTLQYIGSYDRYRLRDFQDVDSTDSPFLLYYPLAAPSGINAGARLDGYFRVHSTTHELRLTSGPGPFHYVFGLWYARNDIARDLDRGPVLQRIHYHATTLNQTYSFYNDLSWDLSSKLTLLGGFRLNRQTIGYTYQNFTAATPFFLSGDTADNAITGKVGAQYHVTRDNMLYATFSTGYKGQAYDLSSVFSATIAANSPVKAETAKNYEIGSKNSFFDRKLQLNVTAFWTDYNGFQTSSITYLPDGFALSLLQSVGKLRTRGFEGDFTARPFAGLSLFGSGAYTDATVTSFPTGPCYPGQPTTALASSTAIPAPGQCGIRPGNISIQNLKGKRLNNAPAWKFNIGGQYDLSLPNDYGAFVSLNYRWQSKVNFSLNQDPRTVQPSYGVFDASIGATAENGRYKLTLFVNNAFNKHYSVFLGNTTLGFSAPGVAASGQIWQPARDAYRYAGVRLDAKF